MRREWPIDIAAEIYFAAKAAGENNSTAAQAVIDEIGEKVVTASVSSIERMMRGHASNHDPIAVPSGMREDLAPELVVPNHAPSLVLFDLHLPQHSERLLSAALNYALRSDIRRVYLGGDTIDLGYFSPFLGRTKHPPQTTDAEMVVTEQAFACLLEVFEELYIFGGNHDQGRWAKATDEMIDFSRLMRMIVGDKVDDMHIGGRRYCVVETPLGPWRITHQAGRGRKRQLSSAEELAMLERQHVMMGHEHTLGIVKERTGQFWACNGGFMGDETLMEYKTKDTTHTRWAPGFVEILDSGWVQLWPAEVAAPVAVSVGGGKQCISE